LIGPYIIHPLPPTDTLEEEMLAGFATGLHHLLEIVVQDLDESGFSKTFSSSLLFSASCVTHPIIAPD